MACRVINPMIREIREGSRYIIRRKKKYVLDSVQIARAFIKKERRKTNG